MIINNALPKGTRIYLGICLSGSHCSTVAAASPLRPGVSNMPIL